MRDAVNSVAGYLYSHFILRDFTYLGSGTAFLVTSAHLLCKWERITASKTNLVIFFGAAYFVGLIMQEACIMIGIFKITPERGPEGGSQAESDENDWALIVHELNSVVHPAAMNVIERAVYIKHIAASFGSAAFFTGLAIIWHALAISETACPWPPVSHRIAFLVALLVFLFCLKENRILVNRQFSHVRILRERYVIPRGANRAADLFVPEQRGLVPPDR